MGIPAEAGTKGISFRFEGKKCSCFRRNTQPRGYYYVILLFVCSYCKVFCYAKVFMVVFFEMLLCLYYLLDPKGELVLCLVESIL